MIKETLLPPEQVAKAAWYGTMMLENEDQWNTVLMSDDITELEMAAERLISSQKNIATITSKDFPLPILEPKLLKLREELIKGRGFALLSGLPCEKYSEREFGIIFFGIGTHLGNARSQNAQGHLLGHIRNLGITSSDPNERVYQTDERPTFHNDSADVVGTLCMKDAKVGGASLLVSSLTIYNEMRKRRPDLLQLLLKPMATVRRDIVINEMLPYHLIPVFNYYNGELTVFYNRKYIDSAQRFDDAPRLTNQEIEALNMFDELANSPKLNFSMRLEPGDMQFVYNHTLLHDRTNFKNWPDETQKRHLFRLLLSIPCDRDLPNVFKLLFGSTEIGNRGGIIVEDTKLHIPWTK